MQGGLTVGEQAHYYLEVPEDVTDAGKNIVSLTITITLSPHRLQTSDTATATFIAVPITRLPLGNRGVATG